MKKRNSKAEPHREFFSNGKLSKEFYTQKGRRHGVFRLLHSNGQLSSESYYVDGEMTGPMKYWAEDGMLYGTKFYFESRPISKKGYLELCASDPKLPKYIEEKTINTFGNFVRQLRRKKREQEKQGPTEDQIREQKRFDDECKTETRENDSKEAIRWLQSSTRKGRELGETTKGAALKFVRKLYALGAVRVWAVRIEADDDGSQYSKRLIVALPDQLAKRGNLYEFCTNQARPTMLGTPAIRLGLKYMAVSLM